MIFLAGSVGQATWSPDPRLLAANPAGSFGKVDMQLGWSRRVRLQLCEVGLHCWRGGLVRALEAGKQHCDDRRDLAHDKSALDIECVPCEPLQEIT